MGKRKKVARKLRESAELIHWAWTVIANAYGGDWSKATPEWRDAATTWRDAYHDHLDHQPLPPVEDETH